MKYKRFRKSEKGQSLVEFGLTLPIFLLLILSTIDPFLFAVDLAISKYYSFYGAREASLFLVDGTNSCKGTVESVINSLPPMFMVSNWTTNIVDEGTLDCTYDTDKNVPRGEQVTVTIQFDYQAIWWIGTWSGEMSTTNIYQ